MDSGNEGAKVKKKRGGARRRPGDIELQRRMTMPFPETSRVVVAASLSPEYVGQSGVVLKIGENPAIRVVELDIRPGIPLKCLTSQLVDADDWIRGE